MQNTAVTLKVQLQQLSSLWNLEVGSAMSFGFATRAHTALIWMETPFCLSVYQSDMEKCKEDVTETEKHLLTPISSGSQISFLFFGFRLTLLQQMADSEDVTDQLQKLRPFFGDRLNLTYSFKW